ncbi:unnamed protein product [Rotaria sp. Silwood1]|nr:unnamed protein product [Rotaria sp. Silwood1]
MEKSIAQPDVLSKRSKFAYSVDYVLNDVTAAMWLSYFIVFYYRVINFTNAAAGYFFLIGQIADAISTIFVMFITIFQFGWASSQVAHLAMINELTHKDGERVALNSYRYAWTFLSSTSLHAAASFFLGFSVIGNESSITSADLPIFRKLTFIVIGFGLIFMIIFHVGLKESNQTTEEKERHSKLISTSNRKLKQMTWKTILCEKEFYQCAVVWTSARIILNIT